MTTDPLRSLDGIEPPDRWEHIALRAAASGPGALQDAPAPVADGSSGRRPVALAAAMVLVVAALAGALAIRAHQPGAPDRAAGQGDPADIWGHRWQLVRVDVAGGSVTDQLLNSQGDPVVLDASTRGTIAIVPCNQQTADAVIRGGRLRLSGGLTTAMGCGDPLESWIRLDRSRIQVRGDALVLQGHLPPHATYRFVRTDRMPVWQQFWNRSWRVTSTVDRSGTTWKPRAAKGPVLDAQERGRLTLGVCGRARARFRDGRLWVSTTWAGMPNLQLCPYGPDRQGPGTVKDVMGGHRSVVEVRGRWLTIRSSAGELRATATSANAPAELFGHRWAVVDVSGLGTPDVPRAGFVLTASGEPGRTTVTVPGCATKVGGEAALRRGVLRIDVAPPNSTARCREALDQRSSGELALAEWFRGFFAQDLSVLVLGQRAMLSADDDPPYAEVSLVRLDP